MKTSTKFVISSIIAIVGYTILNAVITLKTGNSLESTQTACWFGFWTAEIIALASIKNTKTRKKTKKKKTEVAQKEVDAVG